MTFVSHTKSLPWEHVDAKRSDQDVVPPEMWFQEICRSRPAGSWVGDMPEK